MQMQYIFGNPTGKKGRKSVATKKRKKKNPQRITYSLKNKKTKKTVSEGSTGWYPRGSEIATLQTRLKKAQEKKRATKSRAGKKKLATQIKQLREKVDYLRMIKKGGDDEAKSARKKAKGAGKAYSFSSKYEAKAAKRSKKKTKKKGRKKTAKKRKTKKRKSGVRRKKRRKTAKKATTTRKRRKRKKAKKSTTKKRRRKSAKKSAPKKRRKAAKKSGRRRKKRRKSKSVTLKTMGGKITVKKNPKRRKRRKTMRNPYTGGSKMKYRNNPMSFGGFKVSGYDAMELAELGVGGMIYGMANSYISPMFAKIPGMAQFAGALGGTVPTLIAGIALNIISDKVNNRQVKQAASFLGDGLLGAAVVGASVHLSQTFFPAQALSGVDYIPALPGAEKDFGAVDYTPEMYGVNYTPEMAGVDYHAGLSLPGHNQDVDFGEYEESSADFGIVPQGLG
jgi:hypothetical protein